MQKNYGAVVYQVQEQGVLEDGRFLFKSTATSWNYHDILMLASKLD